MSNGLQDRICQADKRESRGREFTKWNVVELVRRSTMTIKLWKGFIEGKGGEWKKA